MDIIRDTDTVEFADKGGDKLILLACPRQRDVEACDAIEREEAFAQLDNLKRLGIDTEGALKEAEKDPEKLAKAQAEASESKNSAPKVRAFRLKVLGQKLIIQGQTYGGDAITEAYQNMSPVSARWVDEKVAEVWDAALPSDADTRGESADAPVPGVSAKPAAHEPPE